MRRIYFVLLVVALGCGKKTESTEAQVSAEPIISETISADEFQKRLSEDPNGVLLDVRTPDEVAGGKIEGAVNIDFRAPDFAEKIKQLDKGKTYYLYCAGGSRSSKAAELMKSNDFKKIYELDGGYNGWSSQGLPVSH
ncbi:MAG: rhodanese-like domain-containing protein [Cyclobacteriaceae bacterium]